LGAAVSSEIELMPDTTTNDDGLLTIREFCEAFSTSRSYTYELLAARKLDGRKNGRLTLITRASARAWAASLPPFESKAQFAA
jgi:excisionase family DNA binding protein